MIAGARTQMRRRKGGTAMFSEPMTYWIGLDTPDSTEEEVAEFSRFYDEVHAHEVLAANPGFARCHRFELLTADSRGVPGPRFLAMYECSEAAAATYLEREHGPAEHKPRYSSGPPAWERREARWRMIWRRIVATDPGAPLPSSIYLVGMDPGPGDAAALAAFDAFYTMTHVPEILASGGYRAGTRLRLEAGLLHPEPGAPSFVACYEADAALTEAIAAGTPDPTVPDPTRALSEGPPAWATRRTAWRHVYRRVGSASA
jgi:hypothetical protein